MRHGFVAAAVVAAGFALASSLPASAQIDPRQPMPCVASAGGVTVGVGNMALAPCARTVQAGNGVGTWGGMRLQTDGQGGVYLNGRFVGTAVNPSGTVGSLRDRCMRGDVAACDQWGDQSERYGEQYQRMYPRGWNR